MRKEKKSNLGEVKTGESDIDALIEAKKVMGRARDKEAIKQLKEIKKLK